MGNQTSCRSCGANLRITFVDLGETPLANAYPASSEEASAEKRYPLHAKVCESCRLVQLDHNVDPDILFSDYAYFSSYSDSWLEHSRRFAKWAVEELQLSAESLVLEVASNDGYLLKEFQELGVEVRGVEPAANVARVAIESGVPTDIRFFGSSVATELRESGLQPDLMVGNNVIAHVPDLNDFVSGISTLLAEQGLVSLEFPHLLSLIERVEFDTIYHEHFSYFSLLSLERVLERHGLSVIDVHRLPTHGGSLRVLAGHRDRRVASSRVEDLRRAENALGLDHSETYEGFTERVESCRQSLRHFLAEAKSQGADVVGYGAAAKGNTLLNYCGVTNNEIAYVVDRSPHKQGRLLPGTHIPIFAPDRLSTTRPAFIFILPWNLKEEITEQLSSARQWGARFVTAIPEVSIHS